LGPAQLSNQLRREKIKISVSTVRNILEENGYTPPRAMVKSERVMRYEAARPRALVHMDFKHFYIHKQKAFLLLLQDDYSRFLCGHKLTDSENMDAVIDVFEECILRYGKMQMLMTDAGSAFYSWNGMNRFQKLISEEYGIDHIKAGSPRSNGKVESVNKQIEKELLNVKEFSSLEDASNGISEWIEFYNFERTHMGLPKEEVPADRFLYGWNKNKGIAKESKNPVWEEVLKVAINKMK
jgi:putative transposase